MKKHKWYVTLSLATLLLGNITPVALAEEVSNIATQIDSELLTHQVKAGDKLATIAKQLKIEEDLLKLVNSRSKFKLATIGNWAVLHKKRYLILADAHFHEYAIYDLKTQDKTKDLPYSKIVPNDEFKQLILALHEKLGHIDGSDHDHAHDEHGHHHHHGHDHAHDGHAHHHHGHDHAHDGHTHHHHGHDHAHDEQTHHNDHNHAHNITDFKPEDIVSEDENGYVIQHGDHFHYVPKKKDPQPAPTPQPDKSSQPDTAPQDATNEPPKQPEIKHSAELDAKLNYIAQTHGVPKESIVVSPTGYFVLSTPGHDFDPTHIHPIAIPIDRVIVPEVTGHPEVDFENELKAMSHLTGIPVFALKIEQNKFLIPHKDHDHYLNIIAIAGIKPYLDSLLPHIKGAYVPGELNVEEVTHKVQTLMQQAQEQYQDDAKQFDRIKLALDRFSYDLASLPNNSTQGYLDMLDKFNQQYISKSNISTPEETAPENEAFNKKYNDLTEVIRQLDLRGYSITRDQLIARLREANDEAGLDKVGAFIDELNHAKPTKIYSIKYLDYFLANIEQSFIDNALREEMADLINLSFKAQFHGRQYTAEQLMDRLIETRQKVQQASERNETNEVRMDGEHYHNLMTGSNQSASKEMIVGFLSEVREFVQSFESKFIPNVTPEETPEATPATTQPNEPLSEHESDATNHSTHTENHTLSESTEPSHSETLTETTASTDDTVESMTESTETESSTETADVSSDHES